MSWQRRYVLGSGHGRVVPGGGWNGLDTLDEHVQGVDIDAARAGAWVHQEVVELCLEMACAVAAGNEARDVRSEWE